jgi:hypothetical protein
MKKEVLLIGLLFLIFASLGFAQPRTYFNYEDVIVDNFFGWTDATWEGVVDNPSKTGINTSDNVGQTTSGSAKWYLDNLKGPELMPIPTAINDLRESELQVSSYPNPFKNTVNFEFYLQKKSNVSLSVFDLSGQELFILNNENLGVGKQQMVWNGTNSSGIAVPDGIYFVKLKINEEIVTWKIIKN